MIHLIKNIQSSFVTEINGNVNYIKHIDGKIQREDYIKIYGFVAFLQNFSKSPITKSLVKPNPFGYKPPINIIQQNVEINY